MMHDKNIEIKSNGGTKISIPLWMAISLVFGLFMGGGSALAWANNTYVSREIYEKDSKSICELLKEMRDELRITNKTTLSIKATLAANRIRIIEVE